MTIRGTTILAIRHNGKVVVAGDGQVTYDVMVMKHTARKVRRLYDDRVAVGFAGATADAFTLFEKFEQKLDIYKGNLLRAAVELTKDWRTDRVLRHLEAFMIAVSAEHFLLISGNGDVIESDDNVMSIGSGSPYALAAARALIRHAPQMDARDIVLAALKVTAELCIYTNENITIEEMLTSEAPLVEDKKTKRSNKKINSKAGSK